MLVNPQKYIKKQSEIEIMREGGKILGNILKQLEDMIEVGIDVWDIERHFLKLCNQYDVFPACKDYAPYDLPPFPTGLCLSVNTQSVHCYPKKGIILKKGDIITIDTDIQHKGLFVDSAFSKGVGEVSDLKKRLLETTKKARDHTIQKVKGGIRVGVLSHSIQKLVQAEGFDVIREYAGHGIGKEMHEYPEIPCYGDKNSGPKIKAGMTICIEPLVCTGKPKIMNKGGWETEMADKGFFCQFEHTVLVTMNGYEILTEPD